MSGVPHVTFQRATADLAEPSAAMVAWHTCCLDGRQSTWPAQTQQTASDSALAPMLSPGESLHMHTNYHFANTG